MSTPSPQPGAFLVAPPDTRTPAPLNIAGATALLKAGGPDTAERFAFFHLTTLPMSGPPLHVHSREDELFYILEGEVVLQIGTDRVTASAGATAFLPRGIPHTYQNFSGAPARLLVLVTPAGLDRFFERLSAGTAPGQRPDPDFFQSLVSEYGMQVVGPPLS